MMPTTATTVVTRELSDQCLHLFLGGFTVLANLSLEVECLSCQWVIGVDSHTVFPYFFHSYHDGFVLWAKQCDDGSWEDVIFVELTVWAENILVEFVSSVRVIFAESVLWSECDVEVGICRTVYQLVLQCIDSVTESGDKFKGVFGRGLLFQLALPFVDGVEFVVG